MKSFPNRVAIVDDEESVRRALHRLLSSYGLDVQVFEGGEQFLASLKAQVPDCVLLDLHMPLISGFDVQQRLAAEGWKIPVVAITGHDAPDTQARTLALGAVAYLRKPVTSTQIMAAIDLATSSGGAGVAP